MQHILSGAPVSKQKQARIRRKKHLLNPANREKDRERSRKRYAETKRRKMALENVLGSPITLSKFHELEAKAENESI